MPDTTNVSNTKISLTDSSSLIVTGTNDTVLVNSGWVQLKMPGGSITVNGTNDTLSIASANSSGVVNGSGAIVR